MPVLITLFLMIVGALLIYLTVGSGGGITTPCNPCYAGGNVKLTAAQIANYAAAAGFAGQDLVTAVAIALAESGGDPAAMGDAGASIGLWQIDTKYHPEDANMDLTDPQTNAIDAFNIYTTAGESFTPWSTYKEGKYNAFLDVAQAGVTG